MTRLIRAIFASIMLTTTSLATAVPITFDTLSDLETVTTQFAGLTFSGAKVLTAGISLNEFEFPPVSGDNVVFDEFGSIEVLFDTPVASVSGLFTYSAALSAAAFDLSNSLLDSVSSSFFNNLALSGEAGSSPNELLSLNSALGISRVVFEGDPLGGSFTLDQFDFSPLDTSVPEPSILLLMLFALFVLFVMRAKPVKYHKVKLMLAFGVAVVTASPSYAVQRVESVVATPALVFVDTPTSVRFSARVAPDDNLIPASVRLLQEQEDGRLAVAATMFDDGSNGDSIAGDLVFTTELAVLVASPSVLKYRVAVAYRGTMRRTQSETVLVRTDLEPFFSPTPDDKLVSSEGVEFAVDEVLVSLIDGEDITTAQSLAASQAGAVVGFAPTANLYQLRVPSASIAALDLIIDALLIDPRVVMAIRNYTTDSVLEPDAANNDAQALPAINNSAYEQIKAFDAWDLLFDIGHSFSPVVVGVLDRGFQRHDEFSGVAFTPGSTRSDVGWAARAGCSTGSKDHGTAVAGLIGAGNKGGSGGDFQTNGVLGGVTDASADGSSVPYKLDTRRLGSTFIENQTLISRMVNAGAKVINMSFGGSRKSALPVDTVIVFFNPGAPAGTAAALATLVGGTVLREGSTRVKLKVNAATEAQTQVHIATLQAQATVASAKSERQCFGVQNVDFNAITNFYRARFNAHPDVMFVVAAGNSSLAVSDAFPANINADNVLTVGASNELADPDTAGAAKFTNTGAGVDIAAPGVSVYAPTDFTAPLDAADYRRVDGTSFSAPITAGALGLMLATDGALEVEQLRKILLATATKNAAVNTISGKIVDLGAAIEFLLVPVDVFMVVDTSGSFSDDLASFRAEAISLVDELDNSGLNIHIGLAQFEDYPIASWGGSADRAYNRVLDIQSIEDGGGGKPIINSINGLTVRSGSDIRESQLVALFQGATGSGQTVAGHPGANIPAGKGATFRNPTVTALKPIRIMILWTDADFHVKNDSNSLVEPVIGYPGPTFEQTIDALNNKGIKVIGIGAGNNAITDLRKVVEGTDTLAPAEGVNCDSDAAIEIPAGQPIVCPISTSGSGIGEAIFNTVIAVVKS
ncbi:S8 family serine peptidase [Thalassomonas haliotis]|uniref:S8 family serine peptidase n=1 Tax=Thalassomonas haliotis TaxID=485448 RepID=A0ABY7VKP2_9GAMM|nr:S8 family serine peptidase [Thalassomonas haliotis]WDE14013.1 S8 family serine peptidase [Thalassomonas haliotis]